MLEMLITIYQTCKTNDKKLFAASSGCKFQIHWTNKTTGTIYSNDFDAELTPTQKSQN